MLAAHELGMTNGEYAFFNIFLFDSNYFGDVSWKRGDEYDQDAKEAYRSLMTFTLRKPDTPKFATFAKKVKEQALANYNFSFDALNEEVNNSLQWLLLLLLLSSFRRCRCRRCCFGNFFNNELFWGNFRIKHQLHVLTVSTIRRKQVFICQCLIMQREEKQRGYLLF